jgi:hypothetical protein
MSDYQLLFLAMASAIHLSIQKINISPRFSALRAIVPSRLTAATSHQWSAK